jgi:hypothetical protein
LSIVSRFAFYPGFRKLHPGYLLRRLVKREN